jgi:hypothetical protein
LSMSFPLPVSAMQLRHRRAGPLRDASISLCAGKSRSKLWQVDDRPSDRPGQNKNGALFSTPFSTRKFG